MGRMERNIDPAALTIAQAKNPQPHRHAHAGPPVPSYGPLPPKQRKPTPTAYTRHLEAKRDRRTIRLYEFTGIDWAPPKEKSSTPPSYFGAGARPGQYDIRNGMGQRKPRKIGKAYQPNGKRERARRSARFT